MLAQLTRAHFDPRLNDRFLVRLGSDRAIEVQLIEVRALREVPAQGPAAKRAPFSLLFRGPGDCYLPQRIYPVEHGQLGTLSIFLVPLGPDGEGMLFEAVFN
jgi:hypothetical protein